jgi:hypothetical protein
VRHDAAQDALSFDQRQVPQVLAMQVRHVERIEIWLAAAVEKLIELRLTVTIQAHEFAIEDGFMRIAASHEQRPGKDL